jgi:glucose/arabinose dehydrogenase
MQGTDHTTRTLLYPRLVNNTLVVSRGSTENVDLGALTQSTGISQVKAFDLSKVPDGGYDYASSGLLLGWGLRNDVGVVEHPVTGGIWSVENSVDQLDRDGVDVHEDNPGEELNFLGYLNGTSSPNQGTNFGYPYCLAAWDTSIIPNNTNITVGTQFAAASSNDTLCANKTEPRLTFQAHMASDKVS